VTAAATAYLQDVRDYQATVQIDPADFITSNIGTVKIYGIDFEAGTKPWHGFTFYGSAELQNSVLSQNVQSNYNTSAPFGLYPNDAIQYVYSRGKRLVDTPNWIVSASVGYSEDGFFGSLTPQCKGDRPTALNNDEMVPSHCSLDATVGYHFSETWGYLKGATLQAYVINALDSSSFGEIYTQGQTNAKAAAGYEIDNLTHAVTKLGPGSISAESYTGEPSSPLFIGVKLSIDVGQ
jgi:outer membrane receptor protein involved in Fe transport